MSVRIVHGKAIPLVPLLASLWLPGAGRAWAREDIACESNVWLRVDRETPVQGAVTVVEVRGQHPIAQVSGSFSGAALRFWANDDRTIHQALVGVDFRRKPGAYQLAVEARLEGGGSSSCTTALDVRDGEFPVQKLTVNNRFVQLSPEDLARSRRETNRLLRIFRTVTAERLWRGPFRAPVEGVKASGSFGKRRILNGQPRSPHSGEDYSAPAGTQIRSTNRGRVVLADDLFFTGNTVVVDHGLGLYALYAHMEKIAVSHGQMVDSGQLLGSVGATGRVTGPHLHWALRLEKARLDPEELMLLPFGSSHSEN